MEQLIKDLKDLGYELVYNESAEEWRVVDFLDYVNNFLPTYFSEIVFKNGYAFSIGTTSDNDGMVVKFRKL